MAIQSTLAEQGVDNAANTALLLLSRILNQSKTWVLAHGEEKLTPHQNTTLQESLKRLLQGFPLPYLLGAWDFYGRTFEITPDVLIPRPESELLVERALHHLQGKNHPRLVDVGTGSGNLAVTLACELPDARILASDISRPALQVAKRNALRLTPTSIDFLQADLLTPIRGSFDVICANLPYIPRQILSGLAVGQWEPQLALDGGESGLRLIGRLLHQAVNRLQPGGAILLEIEATLGAASRQLALTCLPSHSVRLVRDLAGNDRLVEIVAP